MSHDEKRRLTKEDRQAWRDEDALYNNSVYTLVRYINEALDHIDAADEEITLLSECRDRDTTNLAAFSNEVERLRAALAKIHEGCVTFAEMKRYAWRALNNGGEDD